MHIAIVGATGNLGQDIIDQLSSLNRGNITLSAFATEGSMADSVTFGDQSISIEEVKEDSFKDTDLAILAVPAQFAQNIADIAIKSNTQVIDASGALIDEKTPLVLYNSNINDADGSKKVIVSPNPLVQQLVSVLAPLDKSADIKRVVTSTYQSVSGRGKDAIAELFEQSANLLSGQDHMSISSFSTQIGFNCIPATSEFIGEHTREELQISTQTQILMHKQFPITASCIQMPTFIGYSQAVSIEFNNHIDSTKVRQILELAENVSVLDNPKNDEYSTPYGAAETSSIYVSRIRNDISNPNTINLWIVSDNLQLSALNIVNIVKKLSSH
ncbi:MAG TPA: aspartate-semialdehyde dehydrogenase [Alphaproteobacteria bacterium]|nr:aspartate-semialdehyde dehydrogenase [Alphaproteobacteria bacterium]